MAFPSQRFAVSPQRRVYYGGMLLLAAFVGIFFLPSGTFIQGGLFFTASLLFFVFLFNIQWGLYAMAVFGFFSNWFIYLNQYEWARNFAYIAAIDAPLIDFIAIVVALCTLVALLIGIIPVSARPFILLRKTILLYAGFIAVAVVSAGGAFDNNVGLSFKFVARPIIFVFLLYVLLPLVLVNTKALLERVLKIWVVVGVLIALFGLSSLIVVPQSEWWQVTPYGINNLAPLGYNHNLIAEVLIPIIPLAGWLAFEAYRRKELRTMWFYLSGMGLMAVAELLTLSRAGWISFGLQSLLAAYLFRPYAKKAWEAYGQYISALLALFGFALIGYMAFFLKSSIVSSSNFARLVTTQIAEFYFLRSPIIGNGPGMYIPIFANTREYVTEFGDALESHGFLQKILVEEGALGLLLFMGTLVSVLWRLVKGSRQVGIGGELLSVMLVMVTGAIVFQLFNTSYFTSVMWMPIGVALAAWVLYAHHEGEVSV
jgi:hypothetical protein